MEKRELDPIVGQFADPKKIKCKDCFYRDRQELVLNGKVLKIGITKSFCAKYPLPPDGNGKPTAIMFQNADCPYYVKDKENG